MSEDKEHQVPFFSGGNCFHPFACAAAGRAGGILFRRGHVTTCCMMRGTVSWEQFFLGATRRGATHVYFLGIFGLVV
jgi:hypothetical protein